ncbi:MAG: OmpH family outer membrane protein, partial [Candidatus Aminicenantes bacterium]|nr:OmpH family outer membrane protein [Candidatus Aminicenantes bacterium]
KANLKARLNTLALILFFVVTSSPLTAQANLKVAVINSQKAFEQSVEGKKVVSILQEKEQAIKEEIKKRNEEIKKLKDRLANQKLTLSPEAINQLQLEIDQKEAARHKYEQEASADFEQFKSQLIKKIREEMLAVVDELVKEKGYDLVFDLSASGLIYFHPSFDITEEIIHRYDQKKARTN